MNPIKTEFINLAIQCKVLRFGDFVLKSGRNSPYFFNAGDFYTGAALKKIGEFYARTLIHQDIYYEHLFGPAYKGLPLATSTAVALAALGKDVTVTFNRKEKKKHGEGGVLIGAPLSGPTIIIDDVITAGTAFRESKKIIEDNGGELKGVIIALDRSERGEKNGSTLDEIKAQGIDVFSIITFGDILDYLKKNQFDQELTQLLKYHEKYKTD